MKILIVLEGGIVQNVLADEPNVEIALKDFDTDGRAIDDEDIRTDDQGSEYFLSVYEAEFNRDVVRTYFK